MIAARSSRSNSSGKWPSSHQDRQVDPRSLRVGPVLAGGGSDAVGAVLCRPRGGGPVAGDVGVVGGEPRPAGAHRRARSSRSAPARRRRRTSPRSPGRPAPGPAASPRIPPRPSPAARAVPDRSRPARVDRRRGRGTPRYTAAWAPSGWRTFTIDQPVAVEPGDHDAADAEVADAVLRRHVRPRRPSQAMAADRRLGQAADAYQVLTRRPALGRPEPTLGLLDQRPRLAGGEPAVGVGRPRDPSGPPGAGRGQSGSCRPPRRPDRSPRIGEPPDRLGEAESLELHHQRPGRRPPCRTASTSSDGWPGPPGSSGRGPRGTGIATAADAPTASPPAPAGSSPPPPGRSGP